MRDDAVFHSSVQVPKTTSIEPYKHLRNYTETLGLSKIQLRVFLLN